MKQHLRLGVLLAVLAILVTVYLVRPGGADQANTVAGETPTFVGTVRLELGTDILARMHAESPKLVLMSADGSRATVLLWQVSNGQAILQQFAELRPAHYTALAISWPDGSKGQVAVDLRFNEPAQG